MVTKITKPKNVSARRSTSKVPPPEPPQQHVNLLDYVRDNMQVYGKAVNEDRAIVSFQDGLKPVQRRVVWASNTVARTGTVKTARLVGNVIGSFHPHGDSPCAAAIEGMVQNETPLMIGVGNWGTFIDNAAAQRYTNVGLSTYGKTFLMKDYLQVVPKVRNYDGTEWEPLYLPSLLPNVLLGRSTGIGVGLATNIPAFTPDSLLPIFVELFEARHAYSQNKTKANAAKVAAVLNPHKLAKSLTFAFGWGMEIVPNQAKALETWIGTGKGSLKFYCPVTHSDYATRLIVVSKFGPGIALENDKRTGVIDKIKGWSFIHRVSSDKLEWHITVKAGVTPADFDKVIKKVETLMTTSISYALNVTERLMIPNPAVEGGKSPEVRFHSFSLPDLMQAWAAFRIKLERAVINHRIGVADEQIHRVRLLIHAHANLKFLFDALKMRFPTKAALRDHIQAGLKITQDDANVIVDLAYHRLSSLDASMLQADLTKLTDAKADLLKQSQAPILNVIGQMKAFAQSFTKTQDVCLGLVQNSLNSPSKPSST